MPYAAVTAPLTPAMLMRVQGICCILTGLWGSGNGTTAYNENIGAMQVLGACPRRQRRVSALSTLGCLCVLASSAHVQASVSPAVFHGRSCRRVQSSKGWSRMIEQRALMSVERQPQTRGRWCAQITRVGSRLVIQTGAVIIMIFAVIGALTKDGLLCMCCLSFATLWNVYAYN